MLILKIVTTGRIVNNVYKSLHTAKRNEYDMFTDNVDKLEIHVKSHCEN